MTSRTVIYKHSVLPRDYKQSRENQKACRPSVKKVRSLRFQQLLRNLLILTSLIPYLNERHRNECGFHFLKRLNVSNIERVKI